jgi:ParB-like chromosome segregation protein Spo0J
MKTLKIDEIETDGLQVRVGVCEQTVENYAEALKDGAKFPPITVFWDMENYYLADGEHRLKAHIKAGKKNIEADIKRGTKEEAKLFAAGANKAHGLPLSNGDKRKAVAVCLRLMKGSSDADIAKHVGVSRMFVWKMRQPPGRVAPKSTKAQPPAPAATAPDREEEEEAPRVKVYQPKKSDAVILDTIRRPIPDDLVELYSRRSEALGMAEQISAIRVAIRKAQDTSDPAFLHINHSSVLANLDQVYATLKNTVLGVLCPTCHGKPAVRTKCTLCGKTGFISKFMWDTSIPQEKKDFILKAIES